MGAKRKIEAMHALYGRTSRMCADCNHFSIQLWRSRKYFKCDAYSKSCSEASDWRKYYPACGLFDKPLPDGFTPVLERLKHEPRRMPEKPVDGQIGMEV